MVMVHEAKGQTERNLKTLSRHQYLLERVPPFQKCMMTTYV